MNGKSRTTTDQDLGDKITPFLRGYSEFLSRSSIVSASSRVSRSCAYSQFPTRPPIVYITTRPKVFFLVLYCHSHVKLRLLPDRRELHCDHPHPRSGCCRKGKLRSSRSVSVISSTEIEVFITFRSPLGAPMGMAPVTHVLFTRSVYRHCARALRFIGRFGQIFQG